MSKAVNEVSECARLAQSNEFDTRWYLEQYPDVARAGLDPVLHYVRHGRNEGRKPLPDSFAMMRDFSNYDGASSQRPVIPIFFATNSGYIPYLSVALVSLARNPSPKYEYRVFILHNGLSAEDCKILAGHSDTGLNVEPVRVTSWLNDILGKVPVHSHFSVETYFRIVIPKIFTDLKKCIYLDCDIVVNRCLDGLFENDLTGMYVGAVRENWLEPKRIELINKQLNGGVNYYFNAGVLLMNLESFNRYDLYSRFIDLASCGTEWANVDQAVMNLVCDGHVLPLPATWNLLWLYYINEGFKYSTKEHFIDFASNYMNPGIIHYDSWYKPWNREGGRLGAMFWRYAKYSPYYEYLKEECPYPLGSTLARAELLERQA